MEGARGQEKRARNDMDDRGKRGRGKPGKGVELVAARVYEHTSERRVRKRRVRKQRVSKQRARARAGCFAAATERPWPCAALLSDEALSEVVMAAVAKEPLGAACGTRTGSVAVGDGGGGGGGVSGAVGGGGGGGGGMAVQVAFTMAESLVELIVELVVEMLGGGLGGVQRCSRRGGCVDRGRFSNERRGERRLVDVGHVDRLGPRGRRRDGVDVVGEGVRGRGRRCLGDGIGAAAAKPLLHGDEATAARVGNILLEGRLVLLCCHRNVLVVNLVERVWRGRTGSKGRKTAALTRDLPKLGGEIDGVCNAQSAQTSAA
eukprot:1290081-Pleurochrysis_carterae.AAC.2